LLQTSRRLAPIVATLLAFGCSLSEPKPAGLPSFVATVRPLASAAVELVADDSGSFFGHWNTLRGDAYALDDVERFVAPGSKLSTCDPSGLLLYRGEHVRYHGAVTINPAFKERLERFEQVAAEVGIRVYGRAPRRIRHLGSYACRASRNRSYRLSEHALGNAIDVAAFDFGQLAKNEVLPVGVPRALRYAFQVSVAKHWAANKSPVLELHQRFLRDLTAELQKRPDIFRGLIGPADPKHTDHFHFDVSPWRYVRL